MKTTNYSTGPVNFGYRPAYRKWAFTFGTSSGGQHEFITACPGGIETASKVANIVTGSINRTKKSAKGPHVDGLAKANISQIVGTV